MIDQTTADKILTDMFESGWFHQDQIDYFEKEIINSLVSEPGLPQTTADKIISFMDILIGAKGVTLAVELATHMTTNINSLVSEPDKGPRPMTPFEHQWMDFKKVLSELITFQKDYEERTKDYCPGNKYYADKLMGIVNEAKRVVDGEALVSEPMKRFDGRIDDVKIYANQQEWMDEVGISTETDNEIAKRVIEEYIENGLKEKYRKGAGHGWEKGISYKHEVSLLQDCYEWLDKKPYDPHEVAQMS